MTDQALEDCVRAATAAPSIHNSQPWRFRIRDGGIDVFADWQRRLEIIDEPGRELLMSIGAALFNLRVVISRLSQQPITRLFPDSAEPNLISRVLPGRPTPPSDSMASLASLAEAIPRRHTNRRPFAEAEIPATILEEFAAVVRCEGATLHIATPAGRHAILDLARTAERHLRSRGVYRAELTSRPRPAHGGFGGVPAKAHGPWQAIEALPLRDFGLTEPQPRRSIDPYERYPTIVVLSTDGDHAEDWVTAGQALERLLLVATQRGIAATPMSQPLELPRLRQTVAEAGRWPQLILCLGYAPPGTPAPRRPLADVLIKPAG